MVLFLGWADNSVIKGLLHHFSAPSCRHAHEGLAAECSSAILQGFTDVVRSAMHAILDNFRGLYYQHQKYQEPVQYIQMVGKRFDALSRSISNNREFWRLHCAFGCTAFTQVPSASTTWFGCLVKW